VCYLAYGGDSDRNQPDSDGVKYFRCRDTSSASRSDLKLSIDNMIRKKSVSIEIELKEMLRTAYHEVCTDIKKQFTNHDLDIEAPLYSSGKIASVYLSTDKTRLPVALKIFDTEVDYLTDKKTKFADVSFWQMWDIDPGRFLHMRVPEESNIVLCNLHWTRELSHAWMRSVLMAMFKFVLIRASLLINGQRTYFELGSLIENMCLMSVLPTFLLKKTTSNWNLQKYFPVIRLQLFISMKYYRSLHVHQIRRTIRLCVSQILYLYCICME